MCIGIVYICSFICANIVCGTVYLCSLNLEYDTIQRVVVRLLARCLAVAVVVNRSSSKFARRTHLAFLWIQFIFDFVYLHQFPFLALILHLSPSLSHFHSHLPHINFANFILLMLIVGV